MAARIEEGEGELEVSGVRISSPDKVLWEGQGVTKRGLVEYHLAIEEAVLPRLVDRPLTLVRCPSGAGKSCFYQKHAKDSIPDVVPREILAELGRSAGRRPARVHHPRRAGPGGRAGGSVGGVRSGETEHHQGDAPLMFSPRPASREADPVGSRPSGASTPAPPGR